MKSLPHSPAPATAPPPTAQPAAPPPATEDSHAREGAETDLARINAFTISLLQQTTLDDLLWSMVENIGSLLGYEDCVIYLREDGQLVQAAAYGIDEPGSGQIDQPLVLDLGQGIAGTVAATGEALIVHDTRRDERYIADAFGGLSELTVPIVFEDRVLGVIDTERKEAGAFDEADRERLQWIANIAASRIASALADRERRKAEDALRQVHDERRAEKLESLGTLAGGFAHDFNNLLTIILGNINLAERFVGDPSAGARAGKMLVAAHEACLRARDLTKQLLTFASGGAPIKKNSSLGDLLHDSVEFALHGSNVRAELAVSDDLHTIEMDVGQINSALNSLILNAVQAMPRGGVVQVRASNTESPEDGAPAVLVEVEDHGCGIAEEHLDKIFDPYFTTKGKVGTGLGLSTAYKIIKEHGGTLGVQSQVDVGTVFEILLPAAVVEPPPEPAAEAAPTAHQEGGHILFMDDDEGVRESVEHMLRHLGHRVTLARHGEEALRLFAEAQQAGRPFSAVILDLTIPGGLGGKEILPRLRTLDPDVRAIVASGYSNDPLMAEHEKFGFKAVIEKPFELGELDQVLSALLT